MAESIAVFLDRDGVINEDRGFENISNLQMLDRAADAIKLLNSFAKVIIVTNQPAVARNLCTEDEIRRINSGLVDELKRHGAVIDAVYFCPHHPEQHTERNPAYHIECECRKPKPGMLLAEEKEHGIDLKSSFMIGDATADILAGRRAGCRTVLVKTGKAGKDSKYDANPDFICNDLYDAALLLKRIVVGQRW